MMTEEEDWRDVLYHDFTPEQRAAADARNERALQEFIALKDLRRAVEMTQASLSEVMGITQSSLSQLESQSDMKLSTLRGYVESLGGKLDLVVRLPAPDGEQVARVLKVG